MKDREVIDTIIEKRDRENMTFEEIAEYLYNQYGIQKTRQSVHGLYTRNRKIDEDSQVADGIRVDVLNLYVMGYTINKISSLVGISNYKIKTLLENEKAEIERVRNYKVQLVIKPLANENTNIETLKQILKYKCWDITLSGLREIVSMAIELILARNVSAMMSKLRSKGVSPKTLQKSLGMFKRKYEIPLITLRQDE
jgi:arginine/lysine/ornithine decarboxylase